MRKSDNNRIARACGATIVNRTDELREEDIGTKAGVFEIKKVNLSILCCLISFNSFKRNSTYGNYVKSNNYAETFFIVRLQKINV